MAVILKRTEKNPYVSNRRMYLTIEEFKLETHIYAVILDSKISKSEGKNLYIYLTPNSMKNEEFNSIISQEEIIEDITLKYYDEYVYEIDKHNFTNYIIDYCIMDKQYVIKASSLRNLYNDIWSKAELLK